MTPLADVIDPGQHVDHLTALTERLTERLLAEVQAFKAQRPQDTQASAAETIRLANIYRQESARVAKDPSLVSAAPPEKRRRLVEATKTFDEVLARHGRTLKAAKAITEGLIRSIAQAVAAKRSVQPGYGPGAKTWAGDATAISFNQRA
jgi:hypothetical protein